MKNRYNILLKTIEIARSTFELDLSNILDNVIFIFWSI